MPNWLDLLVSATKELESPERYYWWSGVAAISAIVRKNVFINRFSYILYPNVYVLIISAKSGLKKGIPLSWISGFVEKLQCTRVITGRNSIQGVVKELSTQRTLENGVVLSDAQAFLCAPELRSFLVDDDQALTIMTDLHNTHEHEKEWKNSLKSSPVESLKNVCITFLGASNEALLEDLIQSKDIEGGFLARCFVIHESKRRMVNSLMFKPESLISKEDLSAYLKELVNVKGEFKMSHDVRMQYDSWYTHLSSRDYDDRTGSMDRLGDQVLKLAMIVSLSRAPDLEITKKDLEISIDRAQEAILGVKQISSGGGKSEIAPAVSRVLKELLNAPDYTLERKRLLGRLWPDMDNLVFDRVMDTLGETAGSGAIRIFRDPNTKKILYQLNKGIIDHYMKLQGEER